MSDSLDVFEAEQFIAGNLYVKLQVRPVWPPNHSEQLVSEYNAIVDHCETDPSLRIDVAR